MKNDGRIPWNGTSICETSKTCLMGRHPMKGGSEYPFNRQQWSTITLFLRKTSRDYINLVRKSCQVFSSIMYCMRGGIWKGDIMVADIEELEEMDVPELHARRLNAKEVLTPKKGDHFIFHSQSQMEQSNFLGEIRI